MKKAILALSAVVLLTSCGANAQNAQKGNAPIASKPVQIQSESKPIQTQAKPERPKDPNLIWEDNFDTIDTKSWNLLNYGYKDHGRLQYYLEKNVKTANGVLSLNVLKEKYKDFSYTSGAITTEKKVTFKYGRIEVRAKFPKGKGLMPAIWMLPVNGEAYPEVEIAEMIGREPRQLWNVVHWQEKGNYKRDYTMVEGDFTEKFHVYGLEWTKDKLVWTLDGVKTHESSFSPNTEMYLYINVAVGGVWAENPEPNQTFSQPMCIDYVRYYKK